MSDANKFHMSFTSQDNEKTPGETKVFFFNQGNMRTSKFARWNPMPFAGKLTDIFITMTPRWHNSGNGSVYIIKNGQRATFSGFNLYEGVSAHRYTLIDPIQFAGTDHIGMEMILRDVPTDTWPSITCVFEKIEDPSIGPITAGLSNEWLDEHEYDKSSFEFDDSFLDEPPISEGAS